MGSADPVRPSRGGGEFGYGDGGGVGEDERVVWEQRVQGGEDFFLGFCTFYDGLYDGLRLLISPRLTVQWMRS